jgi:hypothetical protein
MIRENRRESRRRDAELRAWIMRADALLRDAIERSKR